MKSSKIYLFAALLIGVAIIAVSFVNKKPTADSKGFAVVELFTSEGCSSCPPADAVVAKIEKESAGKPVYILAFHVDYWNRLGWKDGFSSAAYSNRQKQYAGWLHLQSVYTPQVVVNGRTEFVGSEEGNLRNAIKAGLQKDVSTQITLNDVKVGRNKVNLQYHAQGNTANSVLILAVVQNSAQTKVLGGENGGHTLSHVQIVRGMQSVALKGSDGSASVSLPGGFDVKGAELIAFTQNTTNGAITAATRSAL